MEVLSRAPFNLKNKDRMYASGIASNVMGWSKPSRTNSSIKMAIGPDEVSLPKEIEFDRNGASVTLQKWKCTACTGNEVYEIWAVRGKERIKVGSTSDARIFIVRGLKEVVQDYAYFIRAVEKCGFKDSKLFTAPGAVVNVEEEEPEEVKTAAVMTHVGVGLAVLLIALLN